MEASAAPNQAAGLVGQNSSRWARSAGLWVGSAMTSLGSRKGLVLGGGVWPCLATYFLTRQVQGSSQERASVPYLQCE